MEIRESDFIFLPLKIFDQFPAAWLKIGRFPFDWAKRIVCVWMEERKPAATCPDVANQRTVANKQNENAGKCVDKPPILFPRVVCFSTVNRQELGDGHVTLGDSTKRPSLRVGHS